MALPTGVTTATVTIGRAGDFTGEEGVVKVEVTPNFGGTANRLIWSATGWVFEAWKRTYPNTSGDGSATTTFELPHVDQDGWVSPDQEPFTGWSYTIKVTATAADKQKTTYTKVISPLVGQDNIDLDLLPDAAAGTPTIGDVPAVLTVNGETGHVTVTGGGDTSAIEADIAALETSVTNLGTSKANSSTVTSLSNTVTALAATTSGFAFVNHGSNANTARPTATTVIWAGTVQPNNIDVDYDLWVGPGGI